MVCGVLQMVATMTGRVVTDVYIAACFTGTAVPQTLKGCSEVLSLQPAGVSGERDGQLARKTRRGTVGRQASGRSRGEREEQRLGAGVSCISSAHAESGPAPSVYRGAPLRCVPCVFQVIAAFSSRLPMSQQTGPGLSP